MNIFCTLFLTAYLSVLMASYSFAQNQSMDPVEQPGDSNTSSSEKALIGNENSALSESEAVPGWTLELVVLEKGTGRPVGRAEVAVGEAKQFTNIEGRLTLQGSTERFRATIQKNGFETLQLELTPSEAKEKTIYLFPGTPSDNEVLVKGQKRPEVSKKILTIAEATRAAPGGDPGQITRVLPGVQSKPFGSQIAVRGSGPNDTIYLVDDIALPFLFHPIGNISILPKEYLSQIEFSSGGYGAQYGMGTGGVVKLITPQEAPANNKSTYTLNVPFLVAAYTDHLIDENRWVSVGVRKSTTEYILPPLLKRGSNGGSLTILPYFGDVVASYSDVSGGSLKRWQYLYSQDGLKLAVPSSSGSGEEGKNEFRVFLDFHALSFQNDFNLGDGWALHTSPYTTYATQDSNFNGNTVKLNFCQLFLKNEVIKRLEGKDKLIFGVEPSYLRGQVDVNAIVFQDDPFFDPESAPKRAVKINTRYPFGAAWAGGEFQLGDVFLAPGVRGNWSGQLKKSIADPRLNGRYKLGDDIFKFAVGSYSQEPEPQQMSETYGNPDLAYIRSMHYIGGWEKTFDNTWTVDLQVFRKNFTNLVKNTGGDFGNSGKREATGFETFVRREFTGRLFGWLSYTYSKTSDVDFPGDKKHPSDFDQTHVVHLLGSYKLTNDWETGGRLDMNTGDVFTGIGDVFYNPNIDSYKATSGTGINNRRLPDRKTLSIYAETKSFYDTWTLNWRFGIEGIGIGKQAVSMNYNYDYSKEELFTSLPPIPYIEVRAEL